MATTKKKANTVVDESPLLDERVVLDSYNKVEHFIEDNKRPVLIAVGVIAALLIGYFAYKNLYVPRQNKAASEALIGVQRAFEKGDFEATLKGDGKSPGALEVIDSYGSGSKAGKLAHYYAGIAYLNKGEFQSAIDELGKYSGEDELISSMALGAMGDAYTELGEMDKGIQYYKKAANNSRNEFTAPMFLFKAAMAGETQNDFATAKGLYEQIKQLYPESQQARDIDKYIARAEAKAAAK